MNSLRSCKAKAVKRPQIYDHVGRRACIMIAFKCTGCTSKLSAKDESAGKEIICPKCSTPLLVPSVKGHAACQPPCSESATTSLELFLRDSRSPHDVRGPFTVEELARWQRAEW